MHMISTMTTMRRRVRGFALMEVLVAMFILAIGILGAGALQTIGLQANQGAFLRAQAMYWASDMMDRIRENRAARARYTSVDTASAATKAIAKPSCISTSNGCSANDVANADIAAWVAKINGTATSQAALPGARGVVTALVPGNNIQITITSRSRSLGRRRTGRPASARAPTTPTRSAIRSLQR
jgi:type IV pilus assembly protein PilV